MQRIKSSKNERVKMWRRLQTRKGREKERLFLIEGDHLIEEALKTEQQIQTVILHEDRQDIPFQFATIPTVQVTDQVFKEISETDTPQGIIAVCPLPEQAEITLERGKYLLVDHVQDPGNIGTLIRTAESAGFHAVFLGKGCADLYNSKTIRATQGSFFHIPIYQTSLAPMMTAMKHEGIQVYGTALEKASDYRTVKKHQAFALLVGNEGAGVAEDLLALCHENVYIPIYGKTQSLNVAVAAGILMYGLQS